MSNTRKKHSDKDRRIHTWRNLGDPARSHPVSNILWIWEDWTHASRERQHILEAKSLWVKVFGAATMDPLLQHLKTTELDDCRSDLQRLADRWSEPLRRVLALPRVIQCAAGPHHAPPSAARPVVLFATRDGLIFVVRGQRGSDRFHLRTFYFPDTLVYGIAEWLDFFESTALSALRESYCQTARGRLPDPGNPRHVHQRRKETDRQIRFVTPTAWGFEHDRPGASWIDYPQPPAGPLDKDVPIDEPPPADLESREDEI